MQDMHESREVVLLLSEQRQAYRVAILVRVGPGSLHKSQGLWLVPFSSQLLSAAAPMSDHQ